MIRSLLTVWTLGLAAYLGIACNAQGADAPASTERPQLANELIPLVRTAGRPAGDRVEALHAVFRDKESLSRVEQTDFVRALTDISTNRQENGRLRTDAVWAFRGTTLMLRKDGAWSDKDVSRESQFLLELAADASEDAHVRRISIASIGDLKLTNGAPTVKAILDDRSNVNSPELARPAAIALAAIAPHEALQPIARLLAETTNATVFGSAAYAIGTLKTPEALRVLVENRLRMEDNLSVDNAIEGSYDTVIGLLRNPNNPNIGAAIRATRSLWREEHRQSYSPLLLDILRNKQPPLPVRREALERLLEDSEDLPLDARKNRVAALLEFVEGDGSFNGYILGMKEILGARLLPTTRDDEHREREAAQ